MVGYKLSNNDWVTPFFVIFRSVREILLVTVFLEHPVSSEIFLIQGYKRAVDKIWGPMPKNGVLGRKSSFRAVSRKTPIYFMILVHCKYLI